MRLSFVFCIIALAAIFFKLPGVPDLFGIANCTSCTISTPFLPMLAAGYFSALATLILCFRSFPSFSLKFGGLIWSFGLAFFLTYISPNWCVICMIAHLSHICVWIFWKREFERKENLFGLKLSIIFTCAVSMMALFSTLNFTFMVYGVQMKNPMKKLAKVGSKIKPFSITTSENNTLSTEKVSDLKAVVFHFVSPGCGFCEEQVPQLDMLAKEFHEKGIRFVNISKNLSSDLQALGPNSEWVEDEKGDLRSHFGIPGFPTMILLDSSGVVIKAQPGASDDFIESLKQDLEKLL